MDLHQLAEADLAFTLEGDGQTVTVTNPAGISASLQAISNDISLIIDPETGVPVSGRNANVALRVASLRAAGFEIPKGIEDGASAPWLVEYTTVTGETIITKIMASNPDRALGLVTCRLELVL
mgnify:FL=1|tara:strand:- start:392 stop:760 length:369 start_codon:yes stop_codon:yes gene_type:complete